MILYGVVDFQLLVGTRRAAYAEPEGGCINSSGMHYELHYPLIQIVAFDFVVEGLAGDAELGSGGGEVAAIVSNGLSDHAAFHIFEGRFVRSGCRIGLSGER